MPYSAKCSVCHKAFKTGRSLSNHLDIRHPQARSGTVTFSDESGRIFEGPKPRDIPEEKRDDYLKWLSVLAERVNGSLVPDYPGKWNCTDCFLVPNEYFCHILHRLKNPPLFSVRDVRHRRQPMFKKETKRLSYKIFDEQLFREVMEEQRLVPLKFSALYRNDNEVADLAEMDVEDALAMAKARAKKNIRDTGKPTSRSTIEIEHGEGRYTREVEFIWWPTLYSQASGHGKLSVRYYLKKVSL